MGERLSVLPDLWRPSLGSGAAQSFLAAALHGGSQEEAAMVQLKQVVPIYAEIGQEAGGVAAGNLEME